MEPLSGSLAYAQVERELNEQYTAFEESAKGLMEFTRDFFKSRFMSVQGNYIDCSGPNGFRNLTNEESTKWAKVICIVKKTDSSYGCLDLKELVYEVHFKASQVLNKIKEVMPHNQDFAKLNQKNYELLMNDLYKEALELAKDVKAHPGIYDNTNFGNINLVPIYNAEALRFLKVMQKIRCLPYNLRKGV